MTQTYREEAEAKRSAADAKRIAKNARQRENARLRKLKAPPKVRKEPGLIIDLSIHAVLARTPPELLKPF